MKGYDIIGDIHGQASTLEQMLLRLGYRDEGGVFRHPERKVVYLGDFIDRGRAQRGVCGELLLRRLRATDIVHGNEISTGIG